MTSKFGPQVEKLHAVAGSLSGRLVAVAGERDLPPGAAPVSASVHLLELPAGSTVLSAPVSSAVHALRFLADDLLVCGTADGRLLAFEPAPGKTAPLVELRAHQGTIRALATDLGGQQLLSAGDDGFLRLYSLEVAAGRASLLLRAERQLSARPLRAAAIDGSNLLGAGDDGVIRSVAAAALAGGPLR